MCGIAAHDLSLRPSRQRLAAGVGLGEDMLSRLHHRGPDGHGSRQVGRTWLGHSRHRNDRCGNERCVIGHRPMRTGAATSAASSATGR